MTEEEIIRCMLLNVARNLKEMLGNDVVIDFEEEKNIYRRLPIKYQIQISDWW